MQSQSRKQRVSSSQVKRDLFSQISSENFDQLFQKQEYIGSGTQGDVYKANMGNDLVAIKFIRKPYLKADSIKYILSEIQALKNINHEGILAFIDSYQVIYGPRESQRKFCIVTEYCEESIANYHIIENLNNEVKLKMCLELASAVKAAHQKNILHRDIKPENILVKDLQNMVIKLADFGCCKMSSDPHLSMTTTIGTPLYSDPNFSSGKYTNKCDVYSMVLVMVYIFCGKQYFSDCKTMKELIEEKRRFYMNTEHQARKFLERYGLEFYIQQFFVNISIFTLSNDENNRLTSAMLYYLVQKQMKINQPKRRISQLQKQRDQQNDKPVEEKGSIIKIIDLNKQQILKPTNRNEESKEKKNYQGKSIICINEQQFIDIIQQHSDFTKLKAIYLQEIGITDVGLKALAENSSKFNNLQTINLRSNKITYAGLIALAEKSSNFNNLQIIDLQSNKITDKGLIALAEKSSKFNKLHTINLQNNQIKDIGLISLADNGSKFPNLQIIDLQDNKITDKGLITLIENSSKFNKLHTIDLQNNQITDDGLITLADNGSKFPNLQGIYFEQNQITDKGLIALAKNGSKFPNLIQIYLSKNQIADDGLIALAKNGSKFPNLQTLDLKSNKITDDGLIALAENSSNFSNLWVLYLQKNKITTQGLISLTEKSSKFDNLQQISLNQNQIEDAGLKALAKNISKFPNLQTIYLYDSKISRKYVEQFCSLNPGIVVWTD